MGVLTAIQPRILVEERLQGPDGRQPDEYNLFVLHGRVELLFVDQRRYVDHHKDFYLRDWTPVDVQKGNIYPRGNPPRPRLLARIVEVAEALGQETDFVRVDLYDTGDRVVFGELTNYPSAGRRTTSRRRPTTTSSAGSGRCRGDTSRPAAAECCLNAACETS